MSHIPASKMPHAKPHDDHAAEDHPQDGHAHADAATPPLTPAPEIKPAADAPPPPAKPKPAGSSVPYVAIAAVGALAIGGIVAALALRPSEPPRKPAKNKGGRPRKHPKPD